MHQLDFGYGVTVYTSNGKPAALVFLTEEAYRGAHPHPDGPLGRAAVEVRSEGTETEVLPIPLMRFEAVRRALGGDDWPNQFGNRSASDITSCLLAGTRSSGNKVFWTPRIRRVIIEVALVVALAGIVAAALAMPHEALPIGPLYGTSWD